MVQRLRCSTECFVNDDDVNVIQTIEKRYNSNSSSHDITSAIMDWNDGFKHNSNSIKMMQRCDKMKMLLVTASICDRAFVCLTPIKRNIQRRYDPDVMTIVSAPSNYLIINEVVITTLLIINLIANRLRN